MATKRPPRRSPLGSAAPKPCPVCYAPMNWTGEGYACAKHGKPVKA